MLFTNVLPQVARPTLPSKRLQGPRTLVTDNHDDDLDEFHHGHHRGGSCHHLVYQCFGFFCLDLVSTMEIKICMRHVKNLKISFDIGFVFHSTVDSIVTQPCSIVIEY